MYYIVTKNSLFLKREKIKDVVTYSSSRSIHRSTTIKDPIEADAWLYN